MSKLGPKCQYFVCLNPLGHGAHQSFTGVLFRSSMMKSWSWWMLETLRSSTFRLRMPHRCSIGFRSETCFASPSLLPSASLARQWSLSCWNTALRPSLWREGIMLCFSMSQYMLAFMVPSINCSSPVPAAPMQPRRPWHSHHHTWPTVTRHTCLCTPHLVAATHAWHHLNQIGLSWSHQTTGHGSSNPCS